MWIVIPISHNTRNKVLNAIYKEYIVDATKMSVSFLSHKCISWKHVWVISLHNKYVSRLRFHSFNRFRRRQWHPTPVLLPGKSHGRRSLEGCSPWGSLRVRHDWVTSLSLFTFMHWRRKWQPTPVFLPRESQGWGSLVACCLWGRTESDTRSDLAAEATEGGEACLQQESEGSGLWGGCAGKRANDSNYESF